MASEPPAKRVRTSASPPTPALTTPTAPNPSSSVPAHPDSPSEPAGGCSCLGGWLSPSMRWVLELHISVQLDSLDWQVESFDISEMVPRQPIMFPHISCISSDIYASSSNKNLHAFLWGFVYVLNVILNVLESGRVPTLQVVEEEIRLHQTTGKGAASLLPVQTRAQASHYLVYARCGGSIEMALESALTNAADLFRDEDFEFLPTYGDDPPKWARDRPKRCETNEHSAVGDKHWRRAFSELLGVDHEPQEWFAQEWKEDEDLVDEFAEALAGRYPPEDEDEDEDEEESDDYEVYAEFEGRYSMEIPDIVN